MFTITEASSYPNTKILVNCINHKCFISFDNEK